MIAEGLLELVLRIGADGERFIHRLAEPLDRIGGAGTKHFGVGFDGEELRQR